MALTGEVGELNEILQWLTEEDVQLALTNPEKKNQIADELADILFYLVRFADLADVDLNEAFWQKMKKNAEKYPVSLARGHAKKYTELK